jgi:hypothetical protein
MTKKLQADIPKEILKLLNNLRKNKKLDRDTLLSVIIYEGIENIKNLNKNEIIKKYLKIIEELSEI